MVPLSLLPRLARIVESAGFGPNVARWSLVVLFAWLGAMRFTGAQAEAVGQLLTDNRVLQLASIEISGRAAAVAIGVLQLSTAALLVSWRGVLGRIGAMMVVGLSAVPITLLLTNPVWIDALGGFPAIGSGQGLIKYVAILGVGLFVLGQTQAGARRHAHTTMLVGVMLPLVWIGGMKFTATEAAGIEPLLASSPFFSWMLGVFSLQGASIAIGVGELVTATLLSAWWWRPSWFAAGAALAIVTFLSTLSFLISLPGWSVSAGFPVLNGAGLFIIKDVALLAAAAILLSEHLRRGRSAVSHPPDDPTIG